MSLRIQYASQLMIHQIRSAISPIHPVGDVLILAGKTGPLSHVRVQHFYRWCTHHFSETYTLLDDEEERKLGSILENVHVLNEDYHILPSGHIISGDRSKSCDIHVGHLIPSKASIAQVHSRGSFHVDFEDGLVHVANSLTSKKFDRMKVFVLEDDHIQSLQ
jgi:hypothetical protein